MDILDIGGEPALRFGTFALMLAAMTSWESLLPQRKPGESRGARWFSNLGLAAASTLFARFVLPLGPVAAAALAQERGWGLLALTGGPAWVNWLATLLALDVLIYFQHRVLHAVPVLWRIHRVHHADISLDATTALRFHPFEIIPSALLKAAAVVALGAAPEPVLLYELALSAFAVFNHANVQLPARADRWLRIFFVTPAIHTVHHSTVRNETDSNFGGVVPWWDRLFGTYRATPAAGDAVVIGLPVFRAPPASRLDQLLIHPFLRERP